MELQDIVRRLRMKQSIKAIKRETGKHRRVIRRVLDSPGKRDGWTASERCYRSTNSRKCITSNATARMSRHHPLDQRSEPRSRDGARQRLQLPGGILSSVVDEG